MVREHVGDLDRATLGDDPTTERAAVRRHRDRVGIRVLHERRGDFVSRPELEETPLDDIDERHVRLTEPRTTLHDGVQSRLLIRGGAADHVQDGTRCGLSLQRLLGLVEEAHVLHRDRGLVGKRLDHLELAFVEWLRQVVHHA